MTELDLIITNVQVVLPGEAEAKAVDLWPS